MMDFVLKMMDFFIKDDGFCIKNDDFNGNGEGTVVTSQSGRLRKICRSLCACRCVFVFKMNESCIKSDEFCI